MLDRSLKTLVITTALIPSLLVALALGTYLSLSRLHDIDRNAIDRGVAAATQLALAVRPALDHPDTADARRQLQEMTVLALEESGVRAVSIFDAAGHPLAHAGPRLHNDPPLSPRAARRRIDDVDQFVQPVVTADQFTSGMNTGPTLTDNAPLGWVAMEYSREQQWLSRYRTALISVIFGGLAVLVAFALTAYTSRRFNQAIATLRNAIREIGEGHYDHVLYFEDDQLLQQLGDDINQLAAGVREARIELQRSLEQTNRDLRESLDTVEVQNIELDLARREALEASRIKSEFLANTSHELRTPLNGIIGFTRLLLKSTLEPKQRDYLETIRHSAESLLSIISDILDFSKIEAGKLVIDSMPFSLRDLLEDTLSILAPSAHEKGLALTLDYRRGVPADLVGDPLRLRQILLNLVGNAIKFTGTGSVRVSVQLAAPIDAGRAALHIDVVDTGIGLSAEQLQRVFKPFAQADASTSRLFGGTGLGLVISRQLARQMNGEISVTSEPGSGSVFRLSVQLQLLANLPAAERILPDPARIDHTLQVLAVDDNRTNLRLLALLLEELGVSPHLAGGGEEALALLRDRRFDLVLLDIQMPGVDGRAVAREVRTTSNPNRDTRLIALTAHVLPEEHRDLLQLGFDQCVTKPITEERLQALLVDRDNGQDSAPADSAPRPVDVALALRRARHKPDLARDMLAGVIDMLPAVLEALTTHVQPETLLPVVHKLHGACCYTGTPQLQQCSLTLEEALKRQPPDTAVIAAATAALQSAIGTLQRWQETHDIDVLFDLVS